MLIFLKSVFPFALIYIGITNNNKLLFSDKSEVSIYIFYIKIRYFSSLRIMCTCLHLSSLQDSICIPILICTELTRYRLTL